LAPRPRLLLIGPSSDLLAGATAAAEVTAVPDLPGAAAEALAADRYDGVVLGVETFVSRLTEFCRSELVLAHVDKGLAVLNPDGTIAWANPTLKSMCPGDPVGQPLISALAAQTLAAADPDPIAQARLGRPTTFRLHRPASSEWPYLDVSVTPVPPTPGAVRQLVVTARNVSPEVEQQRKLDALHQAGRELAGLDPDQLAEMNLPTRVELLKQNLRRYIHDLLHYDNIEVRLLDRRTGELKPLLEDGMTEEAAKRVLYARPTNNGVTGYVAATGVSYLCPDTSADPLYLKGATDARSSMTVPLKYHDEVVGTLNVESPRANGFGADDLQFTELFSKEIAAALHTLELLTAQQTCTASQSLDAINKEIALPVDDVLCNATTLLGRLGDADPEATAQLRRILDAARQVKERVQKVGAEFAAADGSGAMPGATPLAGKRVLVVEPDERMRKAAHLILGRLGAEVETTGTATEGIALLADSPFDAVFMDIKPPDLGGYETYRRLRAARPGVPVAMTTGFGYDAAHSIVKARQDGMQYVLFKPFRQDQVVKAVLDGTPTTPPPAVAAGRSA
jgi:CheY-like chemotaxis protein/GAF domain-containing protein